MTALAEHRDVASATLFQQQWSTYRKMVDNDYLFHRGAYGALRRLIDAERTTRFSVLDLACGDAASSAAALNGTAVSRYCGIDLSLEALALAAANLRQLGCPVDLRHADFAEALEAWTEPCDVVWIGLSLHHFETQRKRDLMAAIRRIVGPSGLLAMYECTSPDGETRADWMKGWDSQEPYWTALSADEWRAVTDHVHASDFPETVSGWRDLGHAAGFTRMRDLYTSETGLYRLLAFEA
jgi:ubiquinone/menaquinone biosynthesis C-methylase UbiE